MTAASKTRCRCPNLSETTRASGGKWIQYGLKSFGAVSDSVSQLLDLSLYDANDLFLGSKDSCLASASRFEHAVSTIRISKLSTSLRLWSFLELISPFFQPIF